MECEEVEGLTVLRRAGEGRRGRLCSRREGQGSRGSGEEIASRAKERGLWGGNSREEGKWRPWSGLVIYCVCWAVCRRCHCRCCCLASSTAALPSFAAAFQEVAEDQQLLARLVHQLASPNLREQFEILSIAQRHFMAGSPLRQRTTLPPLAFAALQAVRQATAAGSAGAADTVSLQQWFQFIHQTISALANVPAAEMALELFLAAAQAASQEARLEMVAYELFEQVTRDAGLLWLFERHICRGCNRFWRL